MKFLEKLFRWMPGSKTLQEKEAEFAQTKHELEKTLDRNRRNQTQIIRSMEKDQRRSQRAINTAEDALKVARRVRDIVDDAIS